MTRSARPITDAEIEEYCSVTGVVRPDPENPVAVASFVSWLLEWRWSRETEELVSTVQTALELGHRIYETIEQRHEFARAEVALSELAKRAMSVVEAS